eukprot:474750-Rhodomonas_salina.4
MFRSIRRIRPCFTEYKPAPTDPVRTPQGRELVRRWRAAVAAAVQVASCLACAGFVLCCPILKHLHRALALWPTLNAQHFVQAAECVSFAGLECEEWKSKRMPNTIPASEQDHAISKAAGSFEQMMLRARWDLLTGLKGEDCFASLTWSRQSYTDTRVPDSGHGSAAVQARAVLGHVGLRRRQVWHASISQRRQKCDRVSNLSCGSCGKSMGVSGAAAGDSCPPCFALAEYSARSVSRS